MKVLVKAGPEVPSGWDGLAVPVLPPEAAQEYLELAGKSSTDYFVASGLEAGEALAHAKRWSALGELCSKEPSECVYLPKDCCKVIDMRMVKIVTAEAGDPSQSISELMVGLVLPAMSDRDATELERVRKRDAGSAKRFFVVLGPDVLAALNGAGKLAEFMRARTEGLPPSHFWIPRECCKEV